MSPKDSYTYIYIYIYIYVKAFEHKDRFLGCSWFSTATGRECERGALCVENLQKLKYVRYSSNGFVPPPTEAHQGAPPEPLSSRHASTPASVKGHRSFYPNVWWDCGCGDVWG